MIKRALMIVVVLVASRAYAGLVCYQYQYAPNLVQAVQRTLKQKGLYHGAVDGMWGHKTWDAVRRFQVSEHIVFPPNQMTLDSDEGQLEEKTLKALFGDKAPVGGVTRIPNPHHAPASIWAQSCR